MKRVLRKLARPLMNSRVAKALGKHPKIMELQVAKTLNRNRQAKASRAVDKRGLTGNDLLNLSRIERQKGHVFSYAPLHPAEEARFAHSTLAKWEAEDRKSKASSHNIKRAKKGGGSPYKLTGFARPKKPTKR